MTRINVVPVDELCDQHLLAEYREIMRVPGHRDRYIQNLEAGNTVETIPAHYTMGKGHVRFFYNKGTFLRNRFKEIVDELFRRGFNLTYRNTTIFNCQDDEYMYDYVPDYKALQDNKTRIRNRMPPNPRWGGRKQ